MSYNLDVLAEFTLDAWLLSRVSKRASGSLVDGRTWECVVSDLLRATKHYVSTRPGQNDIIRFSSCFWNCT